MARLDTPRRGLYKPRLRWVPVALMLVPGLVLGEVVGGVQLPDGSERVGENRYRSREDFEATLKYYKTVYPPSAYPRKAIVNQPGIKAIHIVNPSGKNWEGINIYQANDEVRIYILSSEPKPAKKKSDKAGKKEK